jgi:Ser/Thr protein kinase RdoA (MazF antagonist)
MLMTEKARWMAVISRHYGIALRSVDLVCDGFNVTLKVSADTADFYLRLYRAQGRTRRQIDAEIGALLAFKPSRDVYVAKPQRLRGGGWVFSCHYRNQQRWAALFASAPGFPPAGSAHELRQLGRALGILHSQMAHAPPAGRRFDAAAKVAKAAEDVSNLGAEFQLISLKMNEVGSAVVSELNAGGPLQWGFCHGDIWLGKNVHFDGRRTTFFDFDDSIDGPLMIDLATLIAGLWYADLGDFPVQLRLVLDAYAAIRPLPAVDVRAIPALNRLHEISWLGFLAHSCTLEPSSWDTALQSFERRVAQWGTDGAATQAVRDYVANAQARNA